MPDVLSHGTLLRPGTYTLHSKFRSAVNFSSGPAFAFVVDAAVGAGPLNIVLRGIPLDSLEHLVIDGETCTIDGRQYPLGPTTRYHSAIGRCTPVHRERFIGNLPHLERSLVRQSPPKSLAFLLNPDRKAEFTSSFERAYVRRFEEWYRRLQTGAYGYSVGMIKGLGPGLTPSGDDCIAGILIALNVAAQLDGRAQPDCIDRICREAIGENPFTNAFLRCAALGHVGEKWQRLLDALAFGREAEIHSASVAVLQSGETSGADQAVGFLIGVQSELSCRCRLI